MEQPEKVKGGRTVLTRRYDLRGNTISRQMLHWWRIKTRIMGNYDTGPGLICLLKMGALHWFGGPLFRLRIWLRSRYAMKARLRAVASRLKG